MTSWVSTTLSSFVVIGLTEENKLELEQNLNCKKDTKVQKYCLNDK